MRIGTPYSLAPLSVNEQVNGHNCRSADRGTGLKNKEEKKKNSAELGSSSAFPSPSHSFRSRAMVLQDELVQKMF